MKRALALLAICAAAFALHRAGKRTLNDAFNDATDWDEASDVAPVFHAVGDSK